MIPITDKLKELMSSVFQQKVHIKELSCDGVIVGVFFGDSGTQYNTRYFLNGEAKTVYLFDNEIEMV